MNFCDYKDSLGRVGEGPHADRLGGFAIRDVIGTIGLGIVLAILSGECFGFGWNWVSCRGEMWCYIG